MSTSKLWRPTKTDRIQPVWLELMESLNDRLAYLRQQNDMDLDEKASAKLRGQIAEVKRLLNLDKEAPVIED